MNHRKSKMLPPTPRVHHLAARRRAHRHIVCTCCHSRRSGTCMHRRPTQVAANTNKQSKNNKQTTNNKQQTTNNKQQPNNNKQTTNRQQTNNNKQQQTTNKQQTNNKQ